MDHKLCPLCGASMEVKRRNSDNGKFWGCTQWRRTGCKGGIDFEDPRYTKPEPPYLVVRRTNKPSVTMDVGRKYVLKKLGDGKQGYTAYAVNSGVPLCHIPELGRNFEVVKSVVETQETKKPMLNFDDLDKTKSYRVRYLGGGYGFYWIDIGSTYDIRYAVHSGLYWYVRNDANCWTRIWDTEHVCFELVETEETTENKTMKNEEIKWHNDVNDAKYPKNLTLICDASDTYFWVRAFIPSGNFASVYTVEGNDVAMRDIAYPFRICEPRSEDYSAVTTLLDKDAEVKTWSDLRPVVDALNGETTGYFFRSIELPKPPNPKQEAIDEQLSIIRAAEAKLRELNHET